MAQKFRDIVVQRIIDSTLHHFLAKGEDYFEALWNTFLDINQRRLQDGLTADLELCAADHHMYARCQVAFGNVHLPQMHLLTVGYNLEKIWLQITGQLHKRAQTDKPCTPFHPGVLRWGIKGAQIGLEERGRNPDAAHPPLFRPVNEMLPKPVPLIGAIGSTHPAPRPGQALKRIYGR